MKNILMTDTVHSVVPLSALVIGDPHFKVANVRETDAMVEGIVRVAMQRHPDIIIVLGDVLDRHETIHVSPLTRAVKFLARLMEIAPTYVLIGNHDLKNNRQFLSDEHPFNALKHWGSRMTVVDTTTMVTLNGQRFVFVPYVPPGRFIEALDRCPGWERATCIFGHQEFRGAQMGAITSIEGDEWPLINPYVITGHIHDYQEPQVNILYTGTPIQHAFGDRHDKTISYVTFHSPIERQHERIDLGLPRKQIVRITCAEVSTYVPQPNCELKIIIRGTSGEIKAIMKHPSIDVWKKAGYKIVYKDLPLDRVETPEPIDGRPPISKAPQRFSSVLYNAISNNARLGTLYTKIFGSVRVNPLVDPIQVQPDGTIMLKIEPLTSAMNQLTVSVPTPAIPTVKAPGSPSSLTLAPRPQPIVSPIVVPSSKGPQQNNINVTNSIPGSVSGSSALNTISVPKSSLITEGAGVSPSVGLNIVKLPMVPAKTAMSLTLSVGPATTGAIPVPTK